MSGLEVRLATAGDLPTVYALRHEVFVVGQDVPAELERDEHDDGCDHAVALRDGRVVGTGRLLSRSGDGRAATGTVGRMAVEAGERGCGVGAAVLVRLERRAVELGLAAVQLHAQVHARRFYERAGYTAYGQTYLEAGIEHVSMRKQL